MAIQNIMYEDKEALQNDTDVPNKNKVTDEDMNEIKKVVNNNGNEIDVFEQTVKQVQEENREEINNIYKDVQASKIHYETEQAKSLYIDDATDSRGKIVVEGNVEQETREGYNLIDILNLELKGQDKGITVKISPDGYLSANGTVKDSSASYTVFITTNVDNLLTDKETYTLWQEVYGKDQNDGIMLQIIANPKTDVEKKYINSATSKKTFVVDKINYSYVFTIQLGVVDSSTVFNNYKNRYMLYKGTDDKEFELYGASPSLDYPSAIKSLGSNINLVTEVLNNLWYSTDTNKFITTQNTVSAIAEIPQNANITINKKNGGNRFAVMTSYTKPQLDVDLTTIFIDNENLNRKTYTFKNTDKKWVWVGVQNGGTEEDKQKAIEEIKIEEGETATSYSPMGQGSTKIKKTNRNYLDSFNYYTANTSKTINGITFKINPDGTITANGTATANALFDFSYTHVIGTNKKMIINNIGGTATGTVRFTAYNKDFSTTTSVLRETTGTQEMNLSDNIEYSIFRYAVYQNAVCNNLTLGFMVLDKTETDRTYTQHQEENCILNIQQEMLTGDYFDLDRKKEIHNWGKVVLTGTENITLMDHTTKISRFTYSIANCKSVVAEDDENIFAISDKLKGITAKKILQTGNNYPNSVAVINNNRILIDLEGNNITLEDFKEILKSNNIKIYYRLETPVELNLTAEQIEVLEQLNKLRFYKGVNNIFTLEDIALLQGDYEVDLQTLKGIPGPKRRQRRYRCEGRYRSNWSKRG